MHLGDPNLGMFKSGVNAVDYNGSTDYLNRNGALTGISGVTQGLVSLWVRIDGGDGTNRSVFEFGSTGLRMLLSGNKFYMTLADGTGDRHDWSANNSGSGYLASATWRHVLFAWQTQSTKVFQSYITDVLDTNLEIDTGTNFTVPQPTAFGIGSLFGGGSNYWDGCMAETYIALNQYLDISVQANRRKFISSALKPVSLGSDGSTPTGSAPCIYLPNPAAIVGNNAGNGGNFVIHGSPAVASTTP